MASIRVRLVGGLGNQLFCYFAGAAIAGQNDWKLIVDASWTHPAITKHNSTILDFDLPGKWTWQERNPNLSLAHKSKYLLDRATITRKFLKKARRIEDFSADIGWSHEVLNTKSRSTLWGYFQSWRYVEIAHAFGYPTRPILKKESDELHALIAVCKKEKPISLHIRRGDYKSPINSSFGLLAENYYKRAIDLLRSRGHEGPIWIFTDSSTEALSVFKGRIMSGQLSASEELVLMSHCEAHVLANSTFSWWGAWLNPNTPDVIAPSPWFLNGPHITELIPPSWIALNHK